MAELRRSNRLRRGGSSIATGTSTAHGTVLGSAHPDGDSSMFAAAATAAANAARKSHFAHLDSADRWRVEREAFRVRVQEHVERELRRQRIQTAGALGGL